MYNVRFTMHALTITFSVAGATSSSSLPSSSSSLISWWCCTWSSSLLWLWSCSSCLARVRRKFATSAACADCSSAGKGRGNQVQDSTIQPIQHTCTCTLYIMIHVHVSTYMYERNSSHYCYESCITLCKLPLVQRHVMQVHVHVCYNEK